MARLRLVVLDDHREDSDRGARLWTSSMTAPGGGDRHRADVWAGGGWVLVIRRSDMTFIRRS